jgi:hypothetical protein
MSATTNRGRIQVHLPASGGATVALVARWRAAELDRQLAAGARPEDEPLLAIRGRRITSTPNRARLADGLSRTVRDARRASPGFSAAARPDRREVLAASTVLAVLERRLRAPEPVTPRGMALIMMLLTEGAGPLYRPSERGALGSRLRAAAAALEPPER